MVERREFLRRAALAGAGMALAGSEFGRGEAAGDDVSGKGSLKAHALKKGLLAGCAVGAGQLRDTAFLSLVAGQYSLVVAENAMKFGPLAPRPGVYFWDDADALVNFAEQHSMKVRGHNFVWHEQLPTWFKGTVTKDNAKQVMVDHIRTVAARYKGKIQSWDVVNEAVNVPDGRPDGLRLSPWMELIGPEYLEIAYRTARETDPDAKLTYNDYDIETESEKDEQKRAAVIALLKNLKAKGLVDALGIQSHIKVGDKFGKGLRSLMEAAKGLGLEIYLTEMDVNDDPVDADDVAARDKAVAEVYRNYLTMALECSAVKAVLTWGATDAHTWLNGIASHRNKRPGRQQRALPFDEKMEPAPAFYAMRDAMDKAKKRS